VSKRDALVYRDECQWRADACAKAGLPIHAAVWAIAADMCGAAWWSAHHGAIDAELQVMRLCRGE